MRDTLENAGLGGASPPNTPSAALDRTLTAQLIVAWAGETRDDHLGWWDTDLVSRFGGEDLFKELMPRTWPWAILEAAREAAIRVDAARRALDHDPDTIVSLFALGFERNEALRERLRDLKRSGRAPHEALPGLTRGGAMDYDLWTRDAFATWLGAYDAPRTTAAPAGRRISGDPPETLDALVAGLLGALSPLSDTYPLPHYRLRGP